MKYVSVESASARFKIAAETPQKTLLGIALLRYCLFVSAVWLTVQTLYLLGMCMLVLACYSHYICKPYTGWTVSLFRTDFDDHEFVPLKAWMVPNSSAELTGTEYQEVLNGFSAPTLEKMSEIISRHQKLTIHDAANLFFYDTFWSIPKLRKNEYEIVKSRFKDKIIGKS